MMRGLLAPAGWLALLLLAGCGNAPDARYFPLADGYRWTYALREVNPYVDQTEAFVVRNAGSRERDGDTYWLRRNSLDTEYWLKVEGPNILRTGVRTAVEFEPQTDAVPRTVLPLNPKLGDRWEQPSQPFILERVVPFRERFLRHESTRFVLDMAVTAVDEEVTVPAGTFKDCIRVEGEALIHVLADARLGASEVVVRHIEWYAPDVGLIKLHRIEPLETTAIVGGEVTMELTDWSR